MIKHLALAVLLTASAAHAEIYTWRAGGTDFYTNSIEEIPGRYLKKARVLDVATGRKGALATERPVAAPGNAGAPGTGTLPGSATAPGVAAFPTDVGPASPGAAAGPGSSHATPPSRTAPEPVAVSTPPSSTVPPQLTAPRQRSKEGRFQRSRRRDYSVEGE